MAIQVPPEPNERKRYLVYCRVSSQRQVNEGDGLGSQEQRCVNYVNVNGGVVEKIFRDEGVSGNLFDRPAMGGLLRYIDEHAHKTYTVVFDDLARLARDLTVHLKLKVELVKKRGVTLECPNFRFDDSPEGEFIETVLAGKAQLDRQQNRRQVIQKQKARLERGYWPFCPPLALKHTKTTEHGKLLVPNEPYASIFKSAIELYEHNLLNTQHEVREYILGEYKKQGVGRSISIHGVQDTLTKALYAGYVEYTPWEVARREGQHRGIVSKETFENVQNKLLGRSKPKYVKSYSPDFPLKGFVVCAGCGHKLRASWNKGRTKKYPNYWCQTPGCKYRYKVVKRYTMHGEFETLLGKVRLDQGKGQLAKAILRDVWDQGQREYVEDQDRTRVTIDGLQDQIAVLTERVAKTTRPQLIETYEAKIAKLVDEQDALKMTMGVPCYTDKQFGTCMDRLCATLDNPLNLWNSENLEDKRTLLYMFFDNGLSYRYKEGFGTAKYSDGINLLQDLSQGKIRSVETEGCDPSSA